MNHTKAGRKRSFREHCTGAARKARLRDQCKRVRMALRGIGATYVFKGTSAR